MLAPTPPAAPARKDFFISYTARDAAWAEWIASVLERAGFSTVFQGWDFRAGQDFIVKMRDAVRQCERLVAVFSPAYFQSGPAGAEIDVYLGREWGGENRLVIPVLVEPVPERDLFQSRIYIDLTRLDEAAAATALLDGIRATPVDRTASRAFPGKVGAPMPGPSIPFPGSPLPPNNLLAAGITPNDSFVGRVDELARLHAALGAEEGVALTQALVGDGGFGKTEIARAYLFRHGREYDGLWWVDASRERHNLSTEELARTLGFAVPDQVDFPALRRALAAHLGEKKSLLILDNVDEADALRDWRIPAPARRLITTRLRGPDFGRLARIEVDVLPPPDARALLAGDRADLRAGQDPALDAIATELGRHALAVALAGAYLGRHVTARPEDFLEQIRLERSTVSAEVLEKLTPRQHRGEDYTLSVFAALSLHLGELAGQPAGRVLEATAFLHPAGIALPLLAEVLAEWGAGEIDVPAQVDELVRRSVVRYSGAVSLHRLTQRVLRARLAPAPSRDLLRAVLVVLARRLDDALDPMKLGEHQPFIPHAESALAFAKESDLHAEAGELAIDLANYLHTRAEYAASLDAAARAEKEYRTAFGNEHEKVAVAVGIRGYVLRQMGELDAALACFQEAERIVRAAFGDDHPSVAIRVNNRGSVLWDKGDLDGALACFQEAERIDRAAFGDDHPDVARDVNNRGNVLQAKGELDGALACYREAERIDRAAFGDDHPNVAIRVNNRGSVLRAKGELDGALACFQEAERIDRAAFGNDHPNVATCVNNRGFVLQDKGELDGALACYREAFSIWLRKLGPRAGNTLLGARNLAALGVDPVKLAGELAGPEVAAEFEVHYRAARARQA